MEMSSHMVFYIQVSGVYFNPKLLPKKEISFTHITCLQDPIHSGLRYTLETWTYSTTWLDISITKSNNNNFTLYISYLTV
jgi:hypothetical protein